MLVGVLGVLAALVLAGCGVFGVGEAGVDEVWAENGEQADVGYPADKPVLQIEQWPGFGGFRVQATRMVPLVTVWGDGRVVFVLPEDRDDQTSGLIREARLDQATVDRLMSSASVLYPFEDYYKAMAENRMVTDLGSVVFSVWSDQGRKSVQVYGLGLTGPSRWEKDVEPMMNGFRALYNEVLAALPPGAGMMAPDEVTVATRELENPDGEPSLDWPSDLLGHLTGHDVERALALLDVGPMAVARIDGVPHEVTIVPVLPLLSQPTRYDARFPLHPETVGYRVLRETLNAPSYIEYRFGEVDQGEVQAWYRNAMPEAGWRLVKETASSQTWVLGDDNTPDIVTLNFEPGHFTIEEVRYDSGYPEYPDGEYESCGGGGCQFIAGVSIDEARAWFAEQLAYLGWQDGPEVFRKPWTTGNGSYDQLTLTFYERGDGVVMVPYTTTVHPGIPGPTPTPPGGS